MALVWVHAGVDRFHFVCKSSKLEFNKLVFHEELQMKAHIITISCGGIIGGNPGRFLLFSGGNLLCAHEKSLLLILLFMLREEIFSEVNECCFSSHRKIDGC